MTDVNRATDPQPAARPVPRSGLAVATYVLRIKDRGQYRNATSLCMPFAGPCAAADRLDRSHTHGSFMKQCRWGSSMKHARARSHHTASHPRLDAQIACAGHDTRTTHAHATKSPSLKHSTLLARPSPHNQTHEGHLARMLVFVCRAHAEQVTTSGQPAEACARARPPRLYEGFFSRGHIRRGWRH